MTQEHVPVAQADADLVIEIVEHLSDAFDAFTRDRATGKEVGLLDGLMAGHNFYRLVVFDVIEKQGLNLPGREAQRAMFLKMVRDTWTETMNASGALVTPGDDTLGQIEERSDG
jgi:hypothetical protein